jgi:hypothetical protein
LLKIFSAGIFNGIDKNDYVKLLANAGLELRKVNPGKASIGNLRLNVNPADGKYRVSSATLKGTSAYEAGIETGRLYFESRGSKTVRFS